MWTQSGMERHRGTNQGCSIKIYALLCVGWVAGEKLLHNTGALWSPRGVGWDGMEVQEGEDTCILTADAHRTAQTNTLSSNCPPIKNKFKKRV